MRSVRKPLAVIVVSTALGVIIESQVYDGRPWRAPFTGGVALGTIALLSWAERVLTEDEGN